MAGWSAVPHPLRSQCRAPVGPPINQIDPEGPGCGTMSRAPPFTISFGSGRGQVRRWTINGATGDFSEKATGCEHLEPKSFCLHALRNEFPADPWPRRLRAQPALHAPTAGVTLDGVPSCQEPLRLPGPEILEKVKLAGRPAKMTSFRSVLQPMRMAQGVFAQGAPFPLDRCAPARAHAEMGSTLR